MAPPSKADAEKKKREEAEKKKAEAEKKKEVAPPKPPPPPHIVALNELKTAVAQLEKAVVSKEVRFVSRALRHITRIRKRLSVRVIKLALDHLLPPDADIKARLTQLIEGMTDPEVMDTSDESAKKDTTEATNTAAADTTGAAGAGAGAGAATVAAEESPNPPKTYTPEVEVFLWLLVTIFLLDRKMYEEAIQSSTALLDRIEEHNRRSLDQLAAKTYFFYARAHELTNRLPEIRSKLLAAHRTASLRHDHNGQSVLLNLLLRNYLTFHLFDQADALVRKTTFPEQHASNNQHARYLYYIGRIKAVQLDYTDAFNCLEQALRKAPTAAGLGFRLAVNKLTIIVKLLMGDIPDRITFFHKGMVSQLAPYLQITQAVRIGNLDMFRAVMTEHAAKFQADGTYTLIVRLRHNVIKTGLRQIHLTYSNISLRDVCAKLQLDAVEDAEYIVAKAIHDGVIDATIDHVNGIVSSKATQDVYSTDEPQAQFHRRIAFCLDMHNQAVKAMRFPPNTHKRINESEEERKARIAQEEEEIASGLEDDGY